MNSQKVVCHYKKTESMKILLLFIILNCQTIFSQNIETDRLLEKNDSTKVISKKEEKSSGITKFYKYISDNFVQPSSRKFKGGKMLVEFVVKTDGSLGDIKIINDLGFGTAEQMIKIFENSPKWTPGQKNGELVECKYTMPVEIPGN